MYANEENKIELEHEPSIIWVLKNINISAFTNTNLYF